jgi:hypothetical protein
MGTTGARVRLDIAAGCRSAKAMSGMTLHPLAGLPLRYRKYLRSNQVSLPDFRKLSGTHPIAKPLTDFVHSRVEKIRTKKSKGKIGAKDGQVALLDPVPACAGPCDR